MKVKKRLRNNPKITCANLVQNTQKKTTKPMKSIFF